MKAVVGWWALGFLAWLGFVQLIDVENGWLLSLALVIETPLRMIADIHTREYAPAS